MRRLEFPARSYAKIPRTTAIGITLTARHGSITEEKLTWSKIAMSRIVIAMTILRRSTASALIVVEKEIARLISWPASKIVASVSGWRERRPFGEMAEDVLRHGDARVANDSEIDRPERGQVRRIIASNQNPDSEEQGERNRGGDDHRVVGWRASFARHAASARGLARSRGVVSANEAGPQRISYRDVGNVSARVSKPRPASSLPRATDADDARRIRQVRSAARRSPQSRSEEVEWDRAINS
jgi:hypothetical protein